MACATNDILSRALALLGEGAPEDTAGLSALCAVGASSLRSRLREDVSEEDAGDAFLTAAALLGIAAYMELGMAGGVKSIRAGNVSVTSSFPGGGLTDSLRLQAERVMGPYIDDGGFIFMGVRG